MIRIVESSGFIRAYSKLVRRRPELREKLREKLRERLEVFVNNPFDPSLNTHKLSGQLALTISDGSRLVCDDGWRRLQSHRVQWSKEQRMGSASQATIEDYLSFAEDTGKEHS